MKILSLKIIFLAILLGFFLDALNEKETFVAIGNYLQIAIPCVGLALEAFYGNREGIKQFAYAFALMIFTVHGIKFITEDLPIGVRPQGETKSFPSGHAAVSFQGAFFLCTRRGWKWGMPAIILAILTAYSRIYGRYHHWRDIIAGVIIAFAINGLWVTSREKSQE